MPDVEAVSRVLFRVVLAFPPRLFSLLRVFARRWRGGGVSSSSRRLVEAEEEKDEKPPPESVLISAVPFLAYPFI